MVAVTVIVSGVMPSVAAAVPMPMPSSPLMQDEAAAPLPTAESMSSLAGLAGRWTLDLSPAAGLSARQTVVWNEPTASIEVEWSTTDAAGTVVAEGRGRIAWDDIAGAVVNTYAGRDGERRFSGSATLIALEGSVSDWRGHETRGSGSSVNFEVTYDLRDPDIFVVDFIPTCIDGLDNLSPVRFAWNRLDPFVEALPNADELAGDWELASGGHPGMLDGTTMSVGRGAGGRSLVFVLREPDRGGLPGAIMATELIWLDPETGLLHDRYHSVDGMVMDGTPRIGTRGENEQPVVMVRWGEDDPSDHDGMRLTSWMWVAGDVLHVAFTDAEVNGASAEAPPEMRWTRR